MRTNRILTGALGLAAIALTTACTTVNSSPAAATSQTTVEAVKSAALTLCNREVTGSSVAALLDAAQGRFTVEGVAKIACDALKAYSAFSADTAEPPRRKRAKRGTVERGVAVVNGRAVTVTATVPK